MNEDGPDAEAVAELAAKDPSIKGMWVVPTYANPTGSIVSQEVAARLASMETAAPDFKIFWDNAYAFHHLTEDEAKSADILTLAAAAGHPHRPVMFASTSKITFAGAGVAFLGGSVETVKWYLENLGKGAIGPDKLNQLRHAEFFGSPQGVRDHMLKHREIIAPKFEAVQQVLSERLGGLGIASWTQPTGGYFVSMDLLDGTASRVVELAKEAGVSLTPAGASFPNGNDPRNRNIRLAPTFPPLPEVNEAMEAVATCALLAAAEKLQRRRQELTAESGMEPRRRNLPGGAKRRMANCEASATPRANGEGRGKPDQAGGLVEPQPQGARLSRNNEGRP